MAGKVSIQTCKLCGEDMMQQYSDLANVIPKDSRSPCVNVAMAEAIHRTQGAFESKHCRICSRKIKRERKEKILGFPKFILTRTTGFFRRPQQNP